MTKTILWIVGIVVVVGGMIFGGIKACSGPSTDDSAAIAKHEKDSINSVIIGLQNDLDNANAERNDYKAKLDTCENNIQRPLSVEERLAAAEAELANLKAKPAPAQKVRYTAPKQKRSKPADVTETQFAPVSFTAPNRTPVRTETSYTADNTSLPITNYEGEISGDFGTTISSDGHLVYFIKSSVVANNKGNVAPRLNGENGAAFTLDKGTGYWYYIDSRLISGQEINSAGYAVTWNIFIGHVNYGTGSYPAFLPHQSLKPLINGVRGYEYGEITASDLTEMSKSNASIANGTIKPLRLSSSPGHDNANFWHGWNFVTKIYAKKKIVTSMNMDYQKNTNLGYHYVYNHCA